MKNSKFDKYLAVIAIGVFSIFCYGLFYMQCIEYDSDMKFYISDVQDFSKAIRYPYPVFFVLAYFMVWLTNIPVGLALTTTGFNTLSIVILAYYISKYSFKGRRLAVLCSSLASLALHITSMLYLNGIFIGIEHVYLGVFSPNPYHNATYLAARPFAIMTFFLFYELYNQREKIDIPKMILFSVALLMTTLTKPSFTLVFMAVGGIMVMIGIVKGGKGQIMHNIRLCVCFVPTIIDMMRQYFAAFTDQPDYQHMTTSVIQFAEENGQGIGVGLFNVWKLYCGNIPMAIVLANAFPFIYIIMNVRRIKEKTKLEYGLLFFVFAFSSFAFFYQKGLQFTHANFSWGYMYGIFFLHVMCFIDMFSKSSRGENRREKTKTLICCTVFLLHLICGIRYFVFLVFGGYYWI